MLALKDIFKLETLLNKINHFIFNRTPIFIETDTRKTIKS